MSKKNSKNLDVSVQQRLLNLSRERNEDFNLILTRYAVERFLYRLSCSEHAKKFVLKGAMLMAIWIGQSHRPTRDLDLLGFGESAAEILRKIFEEICRIEVERDGLNFDGDSIEIMEIRENQEYPGQRVKLNAKLGNARIRVQIDVGFGDVVTPKAKPLKYPVLLDHPVPRIRAYPKETLIAEKLQSMVFLGMANSRMKDYYDIYILLKSFSFNGNTLVRAIKATFKRRNTQIPQDVPLALSDEFANNRDKVTQWKAFINRNNLANFGVDFLQLVEELRQFLLEPLQAAALDNPFKYKWVENKHWE
jgi:predicted nucleotidyltransferase component of viral defense system